jgi:hypothetical protein
MITRENINLVDSIMAFEDGELGPEETLFLFSHLVKTGLAWQLQGTYGRAAADLINRGILNNDGEILIC